MGFQVSKYYTLHWDRMIISGDAEKLGILVAGSSECVEGKLLGISQISDGTGQTQACTSDKLATEWNVKSSINGLVFDTTASNSGWKNGACVKLKDIFQKKNSSILHAITTYISEFFELCGGSFSGKHQVLTTMNSKILRSLGKFSLIEQKKLRI